MNDINSTNHGYNVENVISAFVWAFIVTAVTRNAIHHDNFEHADLAAAVVVTAEDRGGIDRIPLDLNNLGNSGESIDTEEGVVGVPRSATDVHDTLLLSFVKDLLDLQAGQIFMDLSDLSEAGNVVVVQLCVEETREALLADETVPEQQFHSMDFFIFHRDFLETCHGLPPP